MIELQIAERIVRRGALLAPAVIAALWLWGGPSWAVSAAVGIVMTLGNLWLQARIIGSVAERNPRILLPAGLATFFLGLILLTGIAFALRALEIIYFPVTGLVLIGTHLTLVLWETAASRNSKTTERGGGARTTAKAGS